MLFLELVSLDITRELIINHIWLINFIKIIKIINLNIGYISKLKVYSIVIINTYILINVLFIFL